MKSYKRNQNEELDKVIQHLELQKKQEFEALHFQFNRTYESLKPAQLLNQALVDIRTSPEIKSNLLDSAISIAGGYISKKLIVGKSNSVFKNILGFALQYSITRFISKKVEKTIEKEV